MKLIISEDGVEKRLFKPEQNKDLMVVSYNNTNTG
jgi:hypothetical protein